MTLFVNMIELISLLGIGLMAGASLYISWVEVPARQDLATLDKLVNWQSIFPKAMAVLKTSGMVILPFILLIMVFRFHIGWLVAFALLMALGPFTAKKIAPTNEILLGFTPETDTSEIVRKIADWGRLHNLRTWMTGTAFAAAALASLSM